MNPGTFTTQAVVYRLASARKLAVTLLVGLVLAACGGGGGNEASAGAAPEVPIDAAPAPTSPVNQPPVTAPENKDPGNPSTPAPNPTPTPTPDTGGGQTGDTGGAGSGGSGGTGTGSGGGTGDSGGVAAGPGSGGTGGGGSGSGTGSGGTGATTAGVAVGSVDGFGSVIVNGIRFDTGAASFDLEDISGLALGHIVRIDGSIDATGTTGTATVIHAAQELQGPVAAVHPDATFTVLGQRVTVNASTVYEGLNAVAGLSPGDLVQVSGLPSPAGQLLATRIVKRAGPAANVVATGQVTSMNGGARVIQVGGLTVSYSASTAIEEPVNTTVQVGSYVRVQGTLGAGGVLLASKIRPWQLPAANQAVVAWTGVVGDYVSIGSFKIASLPVDASSASITGGPSNAIGNGVRVELEGVMNGGVLKATKLRIKHVPGTGGPASFSVSGTIGAFVSASSFRVQGQPINAGGIGVVFVNGTPASLRNGKKVSVVGSQVVDGVLTANTVTFE